jgi:hypothetical protein
MTKRKKPVGGRGRLGLRVRLRLRGRGRGGRLGLRRGL